MKNRVQQTLQSAFGHFQAGQPQQAKELCTQALQALPEQPDALFLLAIIHAQARHFEQAGGYFERAIAVNPSRAEFYGNYGNALWEQGRFGEAVDYCRKSLQLKPDSAEVCNTLGNALLSQNEPGEAADSFRKAVHFNAGYFFAHNNLGNALQRLGRFDEAEPCYHRAISLKPDYHEAYNNLGQTLKSLGRIGESYACFRKALELQPNYRKAARNMAEVDPAWLEPLPGKRILLRRYREEDAAYLRHCYQNAAFMRQYNHYIPPHQTQESLSRKLRNAQDAHPCQSRTNDWMILKPDNTGKARPIGVINLVDIQFVFRRAELLTGIPDPAERTAGAALEATLLVMDFAFNKVHLNKLTSFVYADNPQSQQNTLSLGFVQESYLREQISEADGERFMDLYGNGMTEKDFRANRRLGRLSRRLLGRNITASHLET